MLPLYLYMLEDSGILNGKSVDFSKLFGRQNLLRTISFITGPMAFLLYCMYQHQMTGYYFAFSIAQAGWYREFMFPLLSFFRRGDFATQFNSVYTIIVILIFGFSWKKFPLSLNVFIWISLLFPLFSGSVTSMQRFISVIFPFSMILGEWTFSLRNRNLLLVSLLALQLFAFHFWLVGSPFSY